jgi:hypothetical protein
MAVSLQSRWSRLLDGGLILVLALLSPLLVLRTGLKPADTTFGVAVVFAPWTGPEAAILRATSAGASLVRVGALPWIVVVAPEDDGYIERVLVDGALVALDPRVLADCAPVLLSKRAGTP